MQINELLRNPAWQRIGALQVGSPPAVLHFVRHRFVTRYSSMPVPLSRPKKLPPLIRSIHFDSQGATIRRFVTGRGTSKRPEASSADPSSSLFDGDGQTPAFLFPSPNHRDPDGGARPRHLSRIECHPSAISPAVERLSVAEQVAANPRPYFVPSTASASEVLTNVAVQDWFATEELVDAGFYELPGHHPESSSSLLSVSDSWDSFDFVNPFERDDDATDSDEETNSNLEYVEEGTADEPPQSLLQPPKPTTTGPTQILEPVPLPSFVRIDKAIQLISSSAVEVTFRNTRSDSPWGEDDDDKEEVINIPVASFPHPHRLSTITEEDEPVEVEVEDLLSPETGCEEQDDMSDTETIRASGSLALSGLAVDARSDMPSGYTMHDDFSCEYSSRVQTDRRMSV